MKYSKPRGTQDILPPAIYTWLRVEGVFAETFRRFGYRPIRTPIFEATELFMRSVGETTDIVSKEMYTFGDRGGRSLTLRPENTASVIRAYLENGMHRLGGITRLSYMGPMFRYDRPQAGRYRQFHQVGVEAIGSLNPVLDVEIIDVVMTAMDALGFGDLAVKLNSVGCRTCRREYTDVLRSALKKAGARLCEDCIERSDKNPLRVFDCKRCEDVKDDLPAISAYLCEECSDHFDEVQVLLGDLGRSFDLDPRLVRGLDYYTKTTFEIIHGSLGAQNALCGGGRYDDLVEECGGPPTPAVGFSAGVERIIDVLPDGSSRQSDEAAGVDFTLICVDSDAASRALIAANVLRDFGTVEVDASLRVLKTQLRAAEKRGSKITVIVDSKSPGLLIWKDMTERRQVEVPDEQLFETARARVRGGKVV